MNPILAYPPSGTPNTPDCAVTAVLEQSQQEGRTGTLFILGSAWLENAESDTVGRFYHTDLPSARRALETWVEERTADTRDLTPQDLRKEGLENAPSAEAKQQLQDRFEAEDHADGYRLGELHYSGDECEGEWVEAYRLKDDEGNTRFRAWIMALEPENP